MTRKQLLGARSGTGLAQLFAIAMVPPLAISLLAPSIGQRFPIVDALAHGLCIFFAGAVFFSLASFLSTLFGDIWRPLLIGDWHRLRHRDAVVGDPAARHFQGDERRVLFQEWHAAGVGFLTSAALATALLYSAAETLER